MSYKASVVQIVGDKVRTVGPYKSEKGAIRAVDKLVKGWQDAGPYHVTLTLQGAAIKWWREH